MRKLSFIAIGMLALSAGCGDEEPDVQPGFANLRAINLVQGAPNFDVVLNQSAEPTADNIGFTDSSDYHQVAIGSYDVQIRAPDDIVVLDTTIKLEDQRSYTLVIFDHLDNVQAKLFEDVFDIPSGKIKFRLFNTAPGRGPMALYFLPDDNGTPEKLTDAVAYGEASPEVLFEDGNHDVGLDVDLDGVVDATYDLPPLSDGTLANLFAVFDDDGDLDLILQLNDGFTWDLDGTTVGGGEQALVRSINLIPNSPSLSLFAAGATITTDLAFMQQSQYSGVPSGTHDIVVGETGAAPLFTIMDAELSSNQSYTILLFGNAGNPLGRTITDEVSGIPTDRVRVRLVHAAADVGSLDFFDVVSGGEPVALGGDLNFGDTSDSIDLTPGTHRIAIDVNNDAVFDVFFDTPALPAGELANIYAVMDGGTPRLVTQMQSEVTAVGTSM